MMGKSQIRATRILLTSLLLAIPLYATDINITPICPKVSEEDVKALAKDGKVYVGGKEIRLASQKEAGQEYNRHLIENKKNLASFLARSKSLVTVTSHINSHENPLMENHLKTHCPYDLETESEAFVIVLIPNS